MDGFNPYFLVAAIAASIAVFAHGVVGHKKTMKPMTASRLFPTRTFGDEDMVRRIMIVSWHLVTTVFFASAVAMLLMAVGAFESPMLAIFVAAAHGAFLLVGLFVVNRRLKKVLRPLPMTFLFCMTIVAVMSALGARHLLG